MSDSHSDDIDRTTAKSDGSSPPWAGTWRVHRYGGESPGVPTYYEANEETWNVVKIEESGRHVARHPILEIDGERLVLKDEGELDDDAEEWRVEVQDDTVRVTALTGPHEGAVGVAERIESIPEKS